MLKLKAIDSLLKKLQNSYGDRKPPLRHRSAFELLVSVILSAQCTDERVNKVTAELFPKTRACKPEDILTLGEARVKALIHSTGYYNAKTKALMGTAKALKGKNVPSSIEELTRLPGVGRKTAQVVMSQWFHMAAFPVDTHIHRVSNRIGLANSGKNRDKTERQVREIVPQNRLSALHLELIYHGKEICTARKPKCLECPVYEECRWELKPKKSE